MAEFITITVALSRSLMPVYLFGMLAGIGAVWLVFPITFLPLGYVLMVAWVLFRMNTVYKTWSTY